MLKKIFSIDNFNLLNFLFIAVLLGIGYTLLIFSFFELAEIIFIDEYYPLSISSVIIWLVTFILILVQAGIGLVVLKYFLRAKNFISALSLILTSTLIILFQIVFGILLTIANIPNHMIP